MMEVAVNYKKACDAMVENGDSGLDVKFLSGVMTKIKITLFDGLFYLTLLINWRFNAIYFVL